MRLNGLLKSSVQVPTSPVVSVPTNRTGVYAFVDLGDGAYVFEVVAVRSGVQSWALLSVPGVSHSWGRGRERSG
jgi:hypothetical protein